MCKYICAVLSSSVMSDSLQSHGLEAARLLCSWGFSRQEDWSGLPCPSPGDLPNPGIEPRSCALHADSLTSEPPGKPMNTRVDSLSVLQGIFPTQKLNRGLLHCRQILDQLSYQGSPSKGAVDGKKRVAAGPRIEKGSPKMKFKLKNNNL